MGWQLVGLNCALERPRKFTDLESCGDARFDLQLPGQLSSILMVYNMLAERQQVICIAVQPGLTAWLLSQSCERWTRDCSVLPGLGHCLESARL